MVRILLDEVEINLKEKEDFSWLKNYGKVFCVFDQQDSGNICFGVDDGENKKFIKYAGAKTINYKGDLEEAINRLKKSVKIYEDLQHDNLIKIIEHFQINNGYALIFEWVNGDNLHPHWKFNTYEKHNNINSPYFKHKHMNMKNRIESINKIFEFHKYVEEKGYVAIDLYDGSIMYDDKNHVTKICDIDLYNKGYLVNETGEEFWGSKRFKSPEEKTKSMIIDNKTNVYNLGALAFGLLGGELDRSFEKWEADEKLYNIALKAVSEKKEDRYNSILDFYNDWIRESRNYM